MVRTLEVSWEHDFLVASNGVVSPIAIESADTVIAHAAAQVIACGLGDGAIRYRHRTKSLVGGLAVAGHTVAVRDGFAPGAVTRLIDAASGEVRREIACDHKPEGLVATTSAFAWVEQLDGGAAASALVIADAAGDGVSRFPLPAGRTTAVNARGDQIVLVRYGDGIAGAELLAASERGEVLWRQAHEQLQRVEAITADRVIALLSGNGALGAIGFDAATGAEQWRAPLPLGAWPVLAGAELLYVDTKKSRVERRDPQSGALFGSVKLGEGVPGDVLVLAVRDSVLWVQGVPARGDGKPLRAFDITTGAVAASASATWSHGPAIAVTTERVIVNERASAGIQGVLRAYVNPF